MALMYGSSDCQDTLYGRGRSATSFLCLNRVAVWSDGPPEAGKCGILAPGPRLWGLGFRRAPRLQVEKNQLFPLLGRSLLAWDTPMSYGTLSTLYISTVPYHF